MRILSVIFIAVGFLGAGFSLVMLAGTSLPYQDATPEMLAQQTNLIHFWQFLLLTNVLIFIAAVWNLWRLRRKQL